MEALMVIGKLTLSVDEHIIEKARTYSKEHKTSVSRLVSVFLERLSDSDSMTPPRVRRLMGLLPPDVDEAAFHRHVDEKHRV